MKNLKTDLLISMFVGAAAVAFLGSGCDSGSNSASASVSGYQDGYYYGSGFYDPMYNSGYWGGGGVAVVRPIGPRPMPHR